MPLGARRLMTARKISAFRHPNLHCLDKTFCFISEMFKVEIIVMPSKFDTIEDLTTELAAGRADVRCRT